MIKYSGVRSLLLLKAGLRKDDKVLSVNGHSYVDIDHYEAVDILKAAGGFISMRVVREVFVSKKRPAKAPEPKVQPQTNSAAASSPPIENNGSLSSLSRAGSNHSSKSFKANGESLVSVFVVKCSC